MVIKISKIFWGLMGLNAFPVISEALNFKILRRPCPRILVHNLAPQIQNMVRDP